MSVYRFGFLAITILIGSVFFAQAQQKNLNPQSFQSFTSTPISSSTEYTPSFGRMSLQFGSGVLFGSVGGAAGGLVGIAIFAPESEGSGAGLAALGIGVLGAATGYTIGSALGVHVIANSSGYNASFGNILLGNTIGAAAGIGTMVFTTSAFGKGVPVAISLGLALSSTVIGGIIANKLSIDRQIVRSSALFNISDEKTVLSAPSLQLTKIGNYNLSKSYPNDYSASVKLLNISF